MAVHVHTRPRTVEIVERDDYPDDRPLLAPDRAETPPAAPAIGQLAVGETVTVDVPEDSNPTEMAAEMIEPAEAGRQITVDDFDTVFTRYQTPLVNFVYRMVSNREEAYDIVQDVFVKIYRALANGTTVAEGALSSWAYRIAANTTTDALRRRRRITWVPMSVFAEDRGIGAGYPADDSVASTYQGDFTHDHSSPLDSPFQAGNGDMFEESVAEAEIVHTVLAKMPLKYAQCLLLYEHEGFSTAELAEMLRISPSAVKMRLMRARERFIDLYQQLTQDEAQTTAGTRLHKTAEHVRDVLIKHDITVKSDRRKRIPRQAAIQGA